MTLRAILANSLWAIVAPVRSLRAIPDKVRVPYFIFIPFLMLMGIAWGVIHYWVVVDQLLFRLLQPDAMYALIVFAIGSVLGWGMAVLGFCLLARIFRKHVTLAWCEIAACHLWMVWLVSLLFDLLHLLPGIHMRAFTINWLGGLSLAMHAGWLFMFPMLVIQLIACWRVITDRPLLPLGILFGAGSLAIIRLVITPSPEYIRLFARSHGIELEFWAIGFYYSLMLCALVFLIRWRVARSFSESFTNSQALASATAEHK